MNESQIYYITKCNSIKLLPQNSDEKQNLILLVEEFHVKNFLVKSGYNKVFYIDDFITCELAEKYNVLAHSLSIDWSKDDECQDILKIDGIGIGEIFYWHFMQKIFVPFFKFFLAALKIIEIYKVKKIFIDTDFLNYVKIFELLNIEYEVFNNEPDDSVEYEYLVGKKYQYVSPDELLAVPVADFTKKIYFAVRTVFNYANFLNAKRRNILVSSYYPTKPVIKKLLLNFNNVIYFIDEIYAQPYEFNIKSVIDIDDLKIKLAAPFFRKKFIFEGIDCSDYFMCQIIRFVFDNKNKIEDAFCRVSSFINNNSIALFFAAVDGSWLNKIAVKICQMLKIPTVVLANGIICDNYQNEAKRCDFNITYSSSIKKDYYKNARNAVVIGNPYFDQYARFKMKKILPKKTYKVFICPVTYSPNAINCSKHLEDEYLFDILKTLAFYNMNKKTLAIYIKPHPASSIEYLKYFLKYYKFHDIQIVNGRFGDVIKKADLYISNWSTSNFEAAALGIPVIYYKKDKMIFHKPFDGDSEMPAARNQSELKKLIDLFLEKPCNLSLFCNREILEKYMGPLDGYNVERVYSFLEKVLKMHDNKK